jgi:hypothetical protein
MAQENSRKAVTAGEVFYDGELKKLAFSLSFVGVAGQVLRVRYQEFTDGSIRTGFSLDLTFDSQERYFAAMGERFEILSVGNDGLSILHMGKQSSGETPS